MEGGMEVDLLCIGVAAYDLVFEVAALPGVDSKSHASALTTCGGGPAANAAVAARRLGATAALASYIGNDHFGECHVAELQHEGVVLDLLLRGAHSTTLSVALVPPDGRRALMHYKGNAPRLAADAIDLERTRCRALLMDGHEPEVSRAVVRAARARSIPTVLDAGSVHEGTQSLWNQVDYLVASEKFALDFTGAADRNHALAALARDVDRVVVTCGEEGLLFAHRGQSGSFPAFEVSAVDTTGAGDAFHAAFCLALLRGAAWEEILRYASAVAALTCTHMGARPALPKQTDVERFLAAHRR
jgi:sulfofructose kinase